MNRLRAIALAMFLAGAVGADQSAAPAGDKGLFPASEIAWQEGPPSLAKGARMTVLEGDPAKEGMFTMRLRFPDGFIVNPHYHSQVEHVTVISGTLHFGMGGEFERAKTRPMPAGSFGFWPIGMQHFAYTEGETVLQLHGKGPWTITYVDPADDPRGQK
jgi:quercetin dioxygenase-like cupin family protein